MNKLLKHFAEAAVHDKNGDTLHFLPDSRYTEKFAKLIVQECIKQCRLVQSQTLVGTNKDYDHGRDIGIEVCIHAIKDHFLGD